MNSDGDNSRLKQGKQTVPPGQFPPLTFPLPCSVRVRSSGVSRVRVRVGSVELVVRVSRVSIRVRDRVRYMVWVRGNVREGNDNSRLGHSPYPDRLGLKLKVELVGLGLGQLS